MSSSDADEDNLDGARTKGKVSLAMSLIGIFSTIIIVVVVVVYFVVIVDSTVKAVKSVTSTSYCSCLKAQCDDDKFKLCCWCQ